MQEGLKFILTKFWSKDYLYSISDYLISQCDSNFAIVCRYNSSWSRLSIKIRRIGMMLYQSLIEPQDLGVTFADDIISHSALCSLEIFSEHLSLQTGHWHPIFMDHIRRELLTWKWNPCLDTLYQVVLFLQDNSNKRECHQAQRWDFHLPEQPTI